MFMSQLIPDKENFYIRGSNGIIDAEYSKDKIEKLLNFFKEVEK